MLTLAVLDPEHAEPGTEVTLIWGEEDGGTAKPTVERARADRDPRSGLSGSLHRSRSHVVCAGELARRRSLSPDPAGHDTPSRACAVARSPRKSAVAAR